MENNQIRQKVNFLTSNYTSKNIMTKVNQPINFNSTTSTNTSNSLSPIPNFTNSPSFPNTNITSNPISPSWKSELECLPMPPSHPGADYRYSAFDSLRQEGALDHVNMGWSGEMVGERRDQEEERKSQG